MESATGLLWRPIVLSVIAPFLACALIMKWLLPGKMAGLLIVASDPSTTDTQDWNLQAKLIPAGGLLCSTIGAVVSTSAGGVAPAIALAWNIGAVAGLVIVCSTLVWCQQHRRYHRRHPVCLGSAGIDQSSRVSLVPVSLGGGKTANTRRQLP